MIARVEASFAISVVSVFVDAAAYRSGNYAVIAANWSLLSRG
jgi:hypothetical protein